MPTVFIKQFLEACCRSNASVGENAVETARTTYQDLYFIEVDLKACFISMMCALYQKETPILSEALSTGFWVALEKQVHDKNCNVPFNKSWAKSVTYAICFSAGNQGMIDAITHHEIERLQLGDPSEIDSTLMNTIITEATSFVQALCETKIITELRQVMKLMTSELVNKMQTHGYAIGPLGKKYLRTFKSNSAQSLLLQEREILLVSSTIMNCLDNESLRDLGYWEVLCHKHDGCILAFAPRKGVPRPSNAQIVTTFKREFNLMTQLIAKSNGAANPNIID